MTLCARLLARRLLATVAKLENFAPEVANPNLQGMHLQAIASLGTMQYDSPLLLHGPDIPAVEDNQHLRRIWKRKAENSMLLTRRERVVLQILRQLRAVRGCLKWATCRARCPDLLSSDSFPLPPFMAVLKFCAGLYYKVATERAAVVGRAYLLYRKERKSSRV